MIDMEIYEYIRFSYFRLNKSMREISRELGKDWRTVKKAIEGKEPKYNLKKKKVKPVMGEYEEQIKEWLLSDKEVPKKQRHTGTKIYERLVAECDFKGGKSTVIMQVKKLKEELNLISREVFIPSDPEKREGAEVDWGEAYINIKGEQTKAYMFCMRAKYSGKIFVKLYPVMLQECFFNAHIEAFAYFGGVFEEIVYDNLRTAVKKILKGHNRIEQTSFLAFRAYYSFKSIFCNTYKGSEKGGVEGLVKYARNNFLTPIPKCKSYEEINKKLLQKCKKRDDNKTYGQEYTIGELFTKEKGKLLKLPELPYNNYKLMEVKVDKYLTVKIKTNRYSVPKEYIGKRVYVELGLTDVRITYNNKLIAKHLRKFEKHKWVLNPWHYIQTLRRKSRAFKTSRVLTTIEKNWAPIIKEMWELQVEKYGREEGTKNFLDMLLYFSEKTYSDMVTVFELAIEDKTINKESIKMLYEILMEKNIKPENIKTDNLESIMNFTLPVPDVDKFDVLIEDTPKNERQKRRVNRIFQRVEVKRIYRKI